MLNSQDYKPSQISGGSADDAKPPLYGNDFSALNRLKETWDTTSGEMLLGFTLNIITVEEKEIDFTGLDFEHLD